MADHRMKLALASCEIRPLYCGEAASVPQTLLLFPAGWTRLKWDNGRELWYFVDRAAYDAIMRGMSDRGIDIVFDYEHQSTGGANSSPTGKAPAAGWITDLTWSDKGISAKVEWTDSAKKMIEAKEYRYFSPVMRIDLTSLRPFMLKSVTLTNTPATVGISPLAASAISGATGMTEILEKLGLPPDATPEDLMKAIDALLAKVKDAGAMGDHDDDMATAVAKDAGLEGVKTKAELVAAVKTVQATAKTVEATAKAKSDASATESEKLAKRVAELESQDKARRRADFLASAKVVDKAASEALGQLFDLNPELAERMKPTVAGKEAASPERISADPKPGESGKDANREDVIRVAASEWSSDKTVQQWTAKESRWIDGQLLSAGFDPLTDTEAKAHAGVAARNR